jgi:hypothetical protein
LQSLITVIYGNKRSHAEWRIRLESGRHPDACSPPLAIAERLFVSVARGSLRNSYITGTRRKAPVEYRRVPLVCQI